MANHPSNEPSPKPFLPFSRPSIGEEEIEVQDDAIPDDDLILDFPEEDADESSLESEVILDEEDSFEDMSATDPSLAPPMMMESAETPLPLDQESSTFLIKTATFILVILGSSK